MRCLTLTALALCAAGARAQTTRYELRVRIDTAARGVEVSGSLVLSATRSARDSVPLLLSSWMKDVMFTDGNRGPLKVVSDGVEGDRTWWIKPAAPFPAGRPITIRFTYRGDSLTAAQLRVDSLGALVGGGGEIWYPSPGFDSVATGRLTVISPNGWTVIASGTKEPGSGFAFRVRDPGAHFGFAASPLTAYRAQRSRVPLTLYLRRARPNGQALADKAAAMLQALETLFGPLPYARYSMVEVRFGGAVAGTSEAGFFMADESQIEQGLPATFIGHELGHAWWGNLVRTRAGPGRMMLTEAIASFGMTRALVRTEGADALRRLRESQYPGEELRTSPEGYFRLAAAGLEMPLTSVVPRGQLELLRMHRMANTRGWFVYDMLARRTGEERFAGVLREVIHEFAGRTMAWEDFSRRIGQRLGEANRDFLEAWTSRTGAPELSMTWSQRADTVTADLSEDVVLPAVVDVLIADDRGASRTASVRLRNGRAQVRARVPFRATTVTADPERQVLRWTPESRARARALAVATRIEWTRRFGDRDSAVALYRRIAIDSVESIPDTVGARFAFHYQGGLALLSARDTVGTLTALTRALEAERRSPDDSAAVRNATDILARLRRRSPP